MSAREPLNLDAIQARADAASIAPWTTGGDGLVWAPRMGDPVSGSTEPEDAEFIAAARSDVPRLVAELRAALAANERLQGMHREALDRNAPLAGEVRDLRAEVERLRGVASPPKCPNCAPGYDCESGIYTVPPAPAVGILDVVTINDSDGPEAVERELRRVAAETGLNYDDVRDLYDAIGACADEERIEREGHELEQTEFVAFDDGDGRRWWVLRGPAGAVSLTAAIVPAGTNLPPLSTTLMVRDLDGRALFPDCFTAHRAGGETCPALPDGCDADGEAISGVPEVLTSWAATGCDDDVIRDALVDVYRRELLAGGDRS